MADEDEVVPSHPDKDELTGDETGEPAPGEGSDSQGSTETDADQGKRVKDAQAALTKANQRAAESEKKLVELEAKLDTVLKMRPPEQKPPPENPLKWMDEPEFVEGLLDDPKNVQGALKRMVDFFGQTLEMRDRALFHEIETRDASVQSLRGKIAELKKDPDYEGFSDKQLATIARKQEQQAAPPDDGDDDEPVRGGPGGGSAPRGKRQTEQEREVQGWMRRLYKDEA